MFDFKSFVDRLSARITNRGYRGEVREEILDHLECAVEELTAQGVAENEARRQAMERFGSPEEIGAMLNDSARGGGRMRRILWWGLSAAAVAILLTIGGGWTFLWVHEAARVAATNDFSARLARQGVTVEETGRSQWASFFPGSRNRASVIYTDLGVLHVVFLRGPVDGEAIRLTSVHNENGRFRYLVEMDQWSGVIDSSAPDFFTMSGNLFVVTREAALHEAVELALRN